MVTHWWMGGGPKVARVFGNMGVNWGVTGGGGDMSRTKFQGGTTILEVYDYSLK